MTKCGEQDEVTEKQRKSKLRRRRALSDGMTRASSRDVYALSNCKWTGEKDGEGKKNTGRELEINPC